MSINSIRHYLERATKAYPEKTALVDGGVHYSYEELFKKVNQLAGYLKECGFEKGSRVGIYSLKTSEQVIAILALFSTEYILVPITRFLQPEQVDYIVKDAGISCIITDKAKKKNIDEIGFKGKVITYESLEKDVVSFEEIFKCCPDKVECDISGHNNAVITYSFGSCGKPKGIVITHRNLVDSARVASQYLNITKDDVISGVLPFILDYGLNQICSSIYKKATFAIHRMVLPTDFFNHLINDKVTILALMPINITEMFDEDSHRLPNAALLKHVKTITSSGGKITYKMLQNLDHSFPDAKFYSMHGLTEAFRSTYLEPSQIWIRPNSIGKPIPDTEIYVINDEGKECAPREVGELIHRGSYIYKGYWNAPDETSKYYKSIKVLENAIDLDNGLTDETVVCSGDYVYKDEEGYFYFVDRKDDMIKSSGFRISPYEIESVVYKNIKEIKECAVISVDNAEIEEEIVLVYSAIEELSRNEIIFELKKHLAAYMIPSKYVYREKLPTLGLDKEKIDKALLKKEIIEIV